MYCLKQQVENSSLSRMHSNTLWIGKVSVVAYSSLPINPDSARDLAMDNNNRMDYNMDNNVWNFAWSTYWI